MYVDHPVNPPRVWQHAASFRACSWFPPRGFPRGAEFQQITWQKGGGLLAIFVQQRETVVETVVYIIDLYNIFVWICSANVSIMLANNC